MKKFLNVINLFAMLAGVTVTVLLPTFFLSKTNAIVSVIVSMFIIGLNMYYNFGKKDT